MHYAKWIDGLLDVSEEPKDGYKPLTFTDPPEAPSGYEALSFWRETDGAWVQTWEVVLDADEVDDAEALSILLGGAT